MIKRYVSGGANRMRIAVLGWGSLIQDSGRMTLEGKWTVGGPRLPIELSRISKRGHLTFVIDHEHGAPATTYFVMSGKTVLADAREELRIRERTSTTNVGYVDILSGSSQSRSEDDKQTIIHWAEEKGFDAVIWTDLPPKFEMAGSSDFSVERAVAYLQSLEDATAAKARDYIQSAPPETDTPVRRKLTENGWLSRSDLRTYVDAVGEQLIAYILNVDNPAALSSLLSGDLPLTPEQQVVVGVLQQIPNIRLPQDAQIATYTDLLRAILMQQDSEGVTVARHLHLQAGGANPTAAAEDELETALLGLAIDAFPAFLLPPNPQFHLPIFISIDATGLLIRHPQSRRFQDAVFADSEIGSIFSAGNDTSDSSAMVWRNTGMGGGLQLIMLPELILEGAWRRIKIGTPTGGKFANEALSQLRVIRGLLTGKTHRITATIAFTGILLPEGVERVPLSDGTIEVATLSDRELAPAVLKQQLTGTDARGTTTIINYDGDVVLRTNFELKVRATKAPLPSSVDPRPHDMLPPAALERMIERLRLSLLLAVQRESRAQLLPTWRYFDDPFGFGAATSWFDPRTAVGIMPIRLTNEEVQSWVDWYQILSNPRIDHVNLAITRILRAVAERREPTDVLVDAVIAWENIFGTSEGEPTLRVTASLALLLEPAGAKRRTLRTRLTEIYHLRSGVVHGSKAPTQAELPLCQEALDVALRAVRVLTRERTDVLDLKTGAERSLHLIMGG